MPTPRLGSTRRLAIVGLTLLLVLVSLLVVNYKVASLRIANHYLSEYHTQINDYEWRADSLSHWQLPRLTLDIYDTRVTLRNIDIRLDEQKLSLNTLSLTPELINAVAIEAISVELGQEFVLDENKTPDTQGPTLALDLNQIPSINIGQIDLGVKQLPALDGYDLGLNLSHLTLSPDRKFSSELLLENRNLFTISGELTQDVWRANTQVDIKVFDALLNRLIQANIKDKNLQPLLKQYSQLKQTLAVEGQIQSTLELSLQSAMLDSSHSWQSPIVELKQLNGLQLTPKGLAHKSLGEKNTEKDNDKKSRDLPVSITVSGHLANLTLALNPVAISSRLDQDQLQKLVGYLMPSEANADTSAQTSTHTLSAKQPAKNNVQLKFMLSLDNGAMFKLNNQQLDISTLSLQSQLMAQQSHGQPLGKKETIQESPANTKEKGLSIKSQLTLEQLTIAPKDIQSNSGGIGLDIESQLTLETSSEGLQKLNTLLDSNLLPHSVIKKLPNTTPVTVDDLSFHSVGKINIDLGAHVENNPRSIDIDLELEKGMKLNLSKLTNEESNSKINLHSADVNSLSPFKLHFSQQATGKRENETVFEGQLQLPRIKMALEGIEAKTESKLGQDSWSAQRLDVELSQSQTWRVKDQSQGKQFLVQAIKQSLIDTHWKNKLHWHIQQLTMERYNPEKRFNAYQNMVDIKQAKLAQNIKWEENNFESQEIWYLDELSLATREKLTINTAHLTKGQRQIANNKEYSEHLMTKDKGFIEEFIGQIQIEEDSENVLTGLTKIAPVLADKLVDLELDGLMTANIHYQVTPNLKKQSQNIESTLPSESGFLGPNMVLTAQLETQIKEAQGHYKALAFTDLNVNQECQLSSVLLQDDMLVNELPIACHRIEVTASQFNPGINLQNLVIQGKLTTDTHASPIAQTLSLTATSDVLEGRLLVPEFRFDPKGVSSAYIMLQGVELAELLKIQPQVGVYADGIFDAVLPIELEQGTVSIEGGQLTARAPGGLIQIQDNPAIMQMRQSQPHLDFAFSALEHLNYTELSSSLDMQKSGDAILKVNVKGKSQNVERPIHLNYSHEENMLQLFKSLQIGNSLQEQIEESMQ